MKDISYIVQLMGAMGLVLISGASIESKIRHLVPCTIAVISSFLILITRTLFFFIIGVMFCKFVSIGETSTIEWGYAFKAMFCNVMVYMASDLLLKKSAEKLQDVMIREIMEGDE